MADGLAHALQRRALRVREVAAAPAPAPRRVREFAALLREHPEPPAAVVTACDHFADGCWNGALRRLDREFHRRELGRIRFLLLR